VVLSIAGGEELPESSGNVIPKGKKAKGSLREFIPQVLWESLKDLRWVRHNARIRRSLKEKVDRERPDLIHERMSYLHDAGIQVAQEFGIPAILEVNTPMREAKEVFEGSSLLMKRAEKMERRMLELADKVLVVSSAIKEHYIEKYGIPPDKFLVSPNAIDPNELASEEGLRAKKREEMGIREDRMVIGFVGSIFPYHGVDLLIEAYYELLTEEPELVLLIVGDGEQLPELERWTQEKGKGRVFFTGKVGQDEVHRNIAAMDLAVIPSSQWFNSPVKLFEYGMMGKAVLAADVAGVRDVIQDGVDGRIVEMERRALKEEIRNLSLDPGKRRKMGQALQKKILEDHTWERTAKKALEFFTREQESGHKVH
jgi:glycosyltransferase involved in cell wall biosynthesis